MLRVGLIGCGRIAKRHAELLGNNLVEGAELTAVCDIELSRAQALGTQFSVPSFGCMDEMMTQAEIDVAVVLTPSGYHADNVIQLAKYGKHIMVEKPMALTLDDADAMISACDAHNCKLFVIKQNRFNLPVIKLREALEEGRFGKLVMGTVRVRWARHQAYYDQDKWRGTWQMDGGVLTNQASHHVDLLEWMMGEVDSVYAMATTRLAEIETEDTAVVTLKFRNGALGIIEATTAARPTNIEGSVSVLGERGTVVVGGIAVNRMDTWVFEDKREEDAVVMAEFSENPPDVYGFGHQAYYAHVVQCIAEGGPNLVDGMAGRKSLELISAIYESIETGQEVRLRFAPRQCKLGIR
jgi:UDP-N-acetyl-2-amino-2-deoxyglucuronate dehydrogenase